MGDKRISRAVRAIPNKIINIVETLTLLHSMVVYEDLYFSL